MTEIIRCPGCSTRFALRPERVHVGTRRAKCFKCETVFEIGEAVEKLLAAAAPAEEPVEALPPPPPPTPEAASPFAASVPPPVPAVEQESPFASFPLAPPSLTLGDLEGADEEIMEKTLVILPPPPPEAVEAAEAPEAASNGGYTSAKDAIARLMGATPSAPAQGERRSGNRNAMDVEATLDALEVTLGGNAPAAPPAASDATASTMKLTAQEIQAAMASFPIRPPAPPAPLGPPPVIRAMQPPPPKASEPPPTSQGADLLKIQLEQETLNNVSLDQVTTWIEQGRVHEYHMVARQFSDHWIEAVKVPALRPVFDRKRRDDAGRPADLPMAPDLNPPKKSLFGGLFGRN